MIVIPAGGVSLANKHIASASVWVGLTGSVVIASSRALQLVFGFGCCGGFPGLQPVLLKSKYIFQSFLAKGFMCQSSPELSTVVVLLTPPFNLLRNMQMPPRSPHAEPTIFTAPK